MFTLPRALLWPAVAILLTAIFVSAGQTATPAITGEFLFKFAFPVNPGSWYHNPQGYLMTGIASIDTLNVHYRVIDMIPLFYPLSSDPEVREDQEEVGLDRIFKGINDPVFDPDVVAADYNADPAAEYAETNEQTEGDLAHQYFPNDDYFGRQWSLHNTGQTGGTADADIDAPEAWMIQRGDSNVVISITDTGVNFDLLDLKANIWVNPIEDIDNDRVVFDPDDINGIDNDGNGKVDDLIGWDCVGEDNNVKGDEHGSMVSHVLNAVTDNDALMSSISTNCKLMIVRAGSGSGGGSFNADDCAQAIEYAARNWADVINMSWSWTSEKAVIKDACKFAYKRNCVLVASAGNSNSTGKRWPAAWEQDSLDVIAVAGTNHQDKRYSSSTYGTWVDVSAPGESVFTIETDGDTVRANGTSFSAPIVSGIAALLRSGYSGLSNVEIVKQIESTCDNIDALNPGYVGKLGRGRVNAHKALQLNLFGWGADKEVSTNGDDYSAYAPDIATSGDTLYAVWALSPSLPIGVPEVYFSRSTDNGATWSAAVMLSTNDGISSIGPTVAAQGNEVYVAWSDAKWGANLDISFRYSSDYGATFGGERNATYTSATANSERPDIALADSVAHLVWVERSASDSDCFYRTLRDGARRGGLFTVSSEVVGTNAAIARVDVDGDYVQVVWQQDSGGATQIVHRRNTSKGDSTSWSNSVTLRAGAMAALGKPDVASSGRYAYAVWQEVSGATQEIALARNICRGHPQGWGNPGLISPTTDAMNAWDPRIEAMGEGVDVVWDSYNGFNTEVYNSYSTNHWNSYKGPRRVTFNCGSSVGPSVQCEPGWGGGQGNYVYLVWGDNSHSWASGRIRFKRCEPRFIASIEFAGMYDFDHHDLSEWTIGISGGNIIGITPGQNVSPPNSLLMSSHNPGYAWAQTPSCPISLTEPYWLTTWFHLDGTTNDGIVVMDNEEVRLEIMMGTELISGSGVPIEILSPYTWYLIECYATPETGTYDVFVNEQLKATVPSGGVPASTILVGDMIDGPAGYGTARWDNLGFEGVELMGVGPSPRAPMHGRLQIEAFPNPFRGGTNILFTLPALAATFSGSGQAAESEYAGPMIREVKVEVFDARGRLVRSISETAEEARSKLVWWDGSDHNGRRVASGIYVVQVRSALSAGRAKVVMAR